MNLIKYTREALQGKNALLELAKSDFKQRYVENYFGIMWAFFHPLCLILILWFVFQVGFKSAAIDDSPFILWLVAGIVPWFFIAECLTGSSTSIISNAFLVKKVVFKTALLPIIKLTSALIVHVLFVLLLLSLFFLYGYNPEIYWIQLVYYIFCTIVLMMGISWLTSAVVVFFRDLGQIVTIIVQFGFWLTPIFWYIGSIPEEYQVLVRFNPFYYIIEGYRDSLLNNIWFWDKGWINLYYWIVTLLILCLGATTFRKLRPHFADVL